MLVALVLFAVAFFWLTGMENPNVRYRLGSVLPGNARKTSKSLLTPQNLAPSSTLLLSPGNDQLKQISQHYQNLAMDLLPSLVSIQAIPEDEDPKHGGEQALLERFASHGLLPCQSGGGAFIDGNGTILTSFQVLLGSSNWMVQTSDGATYAAVLVGVDPATDIAILRIPRHGTKPVHWSAAGELNFGQPVLFTGVSAEEGPRIFSALISSALQNSLGPQRSLYLEYHLLDRSFHDAQPGWLAVDFESAVVGMVSPLDTSSNVQTGQCPILPSGLLQSVSDRLLTHAAPARGSFLGVMAQELSSTLAKALGVNAGEGVLVADVLPGSPAAQAGLQSGDVVLSFAGHPVSGHLELRQMAAQMAVGARVPLQILRGGKKLKMEAVLQQNPDGFEALVSEWLKRHGTPDSPAAPGALLQALTMAEAKRNAPGDPGAGHLMITAIDAGGFTPSSTLLPGEYVLEIDGQKVDTLKDFQNAVTRTAGARRVLLRVQSEERTRFVVLEAR